MRRHQLQIRGFTILELIVALSVTVLMMFLINALFSATSDGVSTGMALSDVIGAGRAIGDQIERDAQEMLGPTELTPGCLVIVCQVSAPAPFTERRVNYAPGRPVRMDQMMWIRRSSSTGLGSLPIAPLDSTTFSSPGKTEIPNASVIRVWYGHLKLTNPDGSQGADFGVAGPNLNSNTWALGRHALFLAGSDPAPTFANLASGAQADAPAGGLSAGALLFHGQTDCTSVTHYHGTASAALFPTLMVAEGGTGGGYANSLIGGVSDKNTYDTNALAHMFLDNKRLWANPFPAVLPGDNTSWFTSKQIAQMHPILMNNVSDFIVEFAADAVDDPNVVNEADQFEGGPDVDSAGEIIWYGLAANAATNSAGPPSWDLRGILGLEAPTVASVPGGGVGYVFRHGQPHDKFWPYMIRIRYRIQDPRGELRGDPSLEIGDTNPTTGQGTQVGKWFEQIIRVNRG